MSICTYQQLELIVASVLTNFHEDLREWDYNALKDCDAPFIYGYRPTGTNILMMLPKLDDYQWKNALTTTEKRRSLEKDFIVMDYPNRNRHFLHFDGMRLRKRNIEELRKIWFTHVSLL